MPPSNRAVWRNVYCLMRAVFGACARAWARSPEMKEIHERYRRNQAPKNAVAEEDGNFHRQAKLQPWPHQGGGGRKEAHLGRACPSKARRKAARRKTGRAAR